MWIIPLSLQSSGALARVETISDSGAWCPDFAWSLSARSKPMPPPALWKKWKRARKGDPSCAWSLLLAGRIAAPSPANSSAIASHFSLLHILARESPTPASGSGTATRAGCGRRCGAGSKPCANCGASSRTSKAILPKGCARSAASWRRYVTGLRAEYSARRKSALRTGASACSSWPTMSLADSHGHQYTRDRGMKGAERPAGAGKAQMWTTPQAHDVTMRGSGQQPCAKAGNACLARDAAQWPTPRNNTGPSRDPRHKTICAMAQAWPTPQTLDSLNARAPRLKLDREGRDPSTPGSYRGDLKDIAATWPTPNASPERGTTKRYTEGDCRTGRDLKTEARLFHPAPETSTAGGKSSRTRRVLNPRFVEWLMGWPIGWTDCGSAATEWCPTPPPSPGSPSTGSCD